MSDGKSRSWWDWLKRFPPMPTAILALGGLVIIISITTGVVIKDYHVEAYDSLRNYSLTIGVALCVVGIALYSWLEGRQTKPRIPGPYNRNFPFSLHGPQDFEVLSNDQKVPVEAIGKQPPPPGFELKLVYLSQGDKRLWLHGESPKFGWKATNYSGSFNLPVPNLSKTRNYDDREFALFFAGPAAMILLDHHVKVCEYFKRDNKQGWPPIERIPEDLVQCSDAFRVRFYARPT